MTDPEVGGEQRGYGWSPEVQRKVEALCLRDREAWGQLGPEVFNARWITHPPLKPIAEVLYRACGENGDTPPSPEVLEELVKERATRLKPAMADAVRKELALVLTADLSDARMIRAKAAEWARAEACAQATLKAAEWVGRGAIHDGHGGEIIALFQNALAVGKTSEGCLRLVRESQDATKELTMHPQKVPTGFPQLDQAMGGGAEPGLHMVAGAPKMGKTSFLTQLAVGACRQGYTAWFLSGEVTMRPLIRRVLRAMTGWTKRELYLDPERAVARMAAAYSQTRGEIILEYAPGFTVAWMAARLRQLEAQGGRVGVVVADFIDLMKGREQAERRWELEEIGKDLRALAVEAGLPVWTAKALNRGAVSKAIPTEADLAECFGLVYVVDDLFTLCATKEEQERTKPGSGGLPVKAPIIRIFYSVSREEEDKFLVGAWERDNDRQQWRHLPGYLLREAKGVH